MPKKGTGFFDLFKTKYRYNNISTKTINNYGNEIIKDLEIVRSPIRSFLMKALNILTLGTLKTAMDKYGFDRFYHLALIVTLESGKKLLVEKNEQINITDSIKIGDNPEYMKVEINKTITLNEMLNNSIKTIGQEQHFIYNAFKTNCQFFILYLLKSSGLLKDSYYNFLYQDISKLYQELPSYVGTVAKNATDAASDYNTLIGTGVDDKFILHSVIIKKSVPLEQAQKMAADIIKNKNRKFYRVDANSWRFRNIPKTKFIKNSFKSKVVNKNITLIFGQLIM